MFLFPVIPQLSLVLHFLLSCFNDGRQQRHTRVPALGTFSNQLYARILQMLFDVILHTDLCQHPTKTYVICVPKQTHIKSHEYICLHPFVFWQL